MTAAPINDIPLTTLDGDPISLSQFADRALLVVNVASKCGLTPEYAALQKLAGDIQWNFEKFLLAPGGQVVNRFRPRTPPDAPEVIEAVEAVLPR